MLDIIYLFIEIDKSDSGCSVSVSIAKIFSLFLQVVPLVVKMAVGVLPYLNVRASANTLESDVKNSAVLMIFPYLTMAQSLQRETSIYLHISCFSSLTPGLYY